MILKIVGKAIKNERLKKFKFKYSTGKVTKVFDTDKWVFKNINWDF